MKKLAAILLSLAVFSACTGGYSDEEKRAQVDIIKGGWVYQAGTENEVKWTFSKDKFTYEKRPAIQTGVYEFAEIGEGVLTLEVTEQKGDENVVDNEITIEFVSAADSEKQEVMIEGMGPFQKMEQDL